MTDTHQYYPSHRYYTSHHIDITHHIIGTQTPRNVFFSSASLTEIKWGSIFLFVLLVGCVDSCIMTFCAFSQHCSLYYFWRNRWLIPSSMNTNSLSFYLIGLSGLALASTLAFPQSPPLLNTVFCFGFLARRWPCLS